jgi:hypothetical protein
MTRRKSARKWPRPLAVLAAFAVAAAVVAVPSALAAYTTPKLEIRQAGMAATVTATISPDDDPTAVVRIFVPTGTQLTTNQAPGAQLGPVRAVVKALDLGGADLPLEGQLVVASPGQVPASTQAACIGSTTPLATWVMVLGAAGQTLTVPVYLVASPPTQAVLGPAYIQICLPPPDLPAGTPGRATFGAKVYTAQLTVTGVFSQAAGVWLSLWVPYNPGAGTANASGAVVAPASFAPGAIAITAKRAGKGAIVSGRVTQGGQPRAGALVTIRGGAKANRLRRLGSVRVRPNGTYSFRARSGTFFRASAVATAGAAPALCNALGPAIAPIQCVNPTTNGFTVQSRTARKR